MFVSYSIRVYLHAEYLELLQILVSLERESFLENGLLVLTVHLMMVWDRLFVPFIFLREPDTNFKKLGAWQMEIVNFYVASLFHFEFLVSRLFENVVITFVMDFGHNRNLRVSSLFHALRVEVLKFHKSVKVTFGDFIWNCVSDGEGNFFAVDAGIFGLEMEIRLMSSYGATDNLWVFSVVDTVNLVEFEVNAAAFLPAVEK